LPRPLRALNGDSQQAESVEVAVVRQLDYLIDDPGRAWEELHPAQQQVVSKDKLIECFADGLSAFNLGEPEIVSVQDESVPVMGVETMAKTVTVQYTVDGRDETDVVHEADVDGRWRWVIGEDSIAIYETGECP
jgi:hypothetical protein